MAIKVGQHNVKLWHALFLLYLHILGFYGMYLWFQQDRDVWLKSLYMVAILHCTCLIGITAGYHRLWSHRTYEAKEAYRWLVMTMSSIAFQGPIFTWARDHRLHHMFSDTQLDPHTMDNGFFFAHVGWTLCHKSKELVNEGKKLDVTDLLNDKPVMFQKKYYYPFSAFVSFVLPAIIFTPFNGQSFFYNMMVAGFARYIISLNATFCVNSVCHMFGSRPYNKNILPTENIWVSIMTMGEGWHNWHHEYPKDWRASKNEWWMFNPTTTFIKFFEVLGWTNT